MLAVVQAGSQARVREVEDEGIVFTDVWTVTLVFKRVVGDTEATACDQFVADLVGKSNTRSEVGLLYLSQPLTVLVGLL